jgi:hypothetical protein
VKPVSALFLAVGGLLNLLCGRCWSQGDTGQKRRRRKEVEEVEGEAAVGGPMGHKNTAQKLLDFEKKHSEI